MDNSPLSESLIERIFLKLGLNESPSLDLAGLGSVYGAWCDKVPFDNSRKLIHLKLNDPRPLPGDEPVDFFESWLKFGTGGTCWAGNGALCALLESIGFNAYSGVATMAVAPNLPPNHGTVLVEHGGVRYLLDASILHRMPLPMVTGIKTESPAGGVDFRKVDDNWQIFWRPLHMPDGIECRIDYFPSRAVDFQERHEQTRPWSPFNFGLYFRTLRGNKVIGIANGQRWELGAEGAVGSGELSPGERIEILVNELGVGEEIAIQLPPDQPTPPPPGSKTAQRMASGRS